MASLYVNLMILRNELFFYAIERNRIAKTDFEL